MTGCLSGEDLGFGTLWSVGFWDRLRSHIRSTARLGEEGFEERVGPRLGARRGKTKNKNETSKTMMTHPVNYDQ